MARRSVASAAPRASSGCAARPQARTRRFDPPTGVIALERASDAECLEAIRSGQAAAAVTAQLLDDELAGQGLRALVEDPVVQERRVIVVRGSGSDVTTLLTALDETLRDAPTSRALVGCLAASVRRSDLTEGIP